MTSKKRFQPVLRFRRSIKNVNWKSDNTKTLSEARIIFPFPLKIKRKQIYEKEGQDIYIIRITTTFECQQVNFLIYPDFLRQPAARVKTKIEDFIKILIEPQSILLLTETRTWTEHKLLVQLVT